MTQRKALDRDRELESESEANVKTSTLHIDWEKAIDKNEVRAISRHVWQKRILLF